MTKLRYHRYSPFHINHNSMNGIPSQFLHGVHAHLKKREGRIEF